MKAKVAVAVAIVAVPLGVLFPFTVDDTFIPCRFAENLALGHGFAFNPGRPVQGVTGLAWTFLLAAGRLLGIRDLPMLAKALGVLFALATSALAVGAAARRTGGRLGWLGVALLLATSVSFAAYGGAGLETPLFALVVLAGTLHAMGGRRRAALLAGLLLGLSVWVRPEGLVPLVAACVARPRRAPRMLAAAAPILAALAVTKYSLFGALLPETYHARLAPPGEGLDYLGGALLPTGLAPLLVLAAFAAWRGGARERTGAVVVAAMLAAVVWVGGDWMPAWRFLVPLWPILALVAVRGVLYVRLAVPRSRLGRLVGPVILGAGLLPAALTLVAVAPTARAAARDLRAGGDALVSALEDARVVALVDVGWVGWRTKAEIVDLGGLTDRTIARARGFHVDKEVPERYLRRRAPDAIVVHAVERPRVEDGAIVTLRGTHPVEQRVASMPFVREGYRVSRVLRHSEGYWYVVLRPRKGGTLAAW